jgi:hypothetical protein
MPKPAIPYGPRMWKSLRLHAQIEAPMMALSWLLKDVRVSLPVPKLHREIV